MEATNVDLSDVPDSVLEYVKQEWGEYGDIDHVTKWDDGSYTVTFQSGDVISGITTQEKGKAL